MGTRTQEQFALLTDYATTTAYVQAFYTLFANIRFHWENELQQDGQEQTEATRLHTLLVTAASAYKNRASMAANLAIVAAQSGTETILVDADLRQPGIQQRFGLPLGAGLSDLLESEEITPPKIAACLQSTFVPGLRVLGSGTASSAGSALLLSHNLERVNGALRTLLASSAKPSGLALFHSAPVQSGADASLIGALTDQTVLAVVLGQTTRAQARQAQEQLEQAHVRLAGVMLLHP